jgi:uracil-DNA glycosylase
MDSQLRAILLQAYAPCPGFQSDCQDMRWEPSIGHVPRGFCGATGSLDEVELVLVVAEPGDPHAGEGHSHADAAGRLLSAYGYATECVRNGKDQYHRNIRSIMNMCWPDVSFDDQLRRTWITESVLCSARREGGSVPSRAWRQCRSRYLEAQLALFADASIIALGRKAQDRLAGIPGVIPAWAAAPPGCNRREAPASWEAAARIVRARDGRAV